MSEAKKEKCYKLQFFRQVSVFDKELKLMQSEVELIKLNLLLENVVESFLVNVRKFTNNRVDIVQIFP